jgi:hypothetical protein
MIIRRIIPIIPKNGSNATDKQATLEFPPLQDNCFSLSEPVQVPFHTVSIFPVELHLFSTLVLY